MNKAAILNINHQISTLPFKNYPPFEYELILQPPLNCQNKTLVINSKTSIKLSFLPKVILIKTAGKKVLRMVQYCKICRL